MDFKTLMDNIPGVFWRCCCDEHWTMKFMSGGIESLTGYRPDELVGNRVTSFASLIHPADVEMVDQAVHHAIDNHTSWDIEYRLIDRNNVTRWVSEQGIAIRNDNKVEYLDGFVVDVSERRSIQDALRQSEERVKQLAFYDPVTELPNRNLIFEHVKSTLANRTTPIERFGLFFIDLDGFKPVNDEYGHVIGDAVLKTVGQRCKSIIGTDGMAARIGGDEFLVFVKDADTLQLQAIANALLDQVNTPISIQQQQVQLSASIGISQYPCDGQTLDKLIREADSAMYTAKRSGKNAIYCATGGNYPPTTGEENRMAA